ncbi:MAG: hypothetical protein AABZ47_07960, partial [Planctomycetota bacterium]
MCRFIGTLQPTPLSPPDQSAAWDRVSHKVLTGQKGEEGEEVMQGLIARSEIPRTDHRRYGSS